MKLVVLVSPLPARVEWLTAYSLLRVAGLHVRVIRSNFRGQDFWCQLKPDSEIACITVFDSHPAPGRPSESAGGAKKSNVLRKARRLYSGRVLRGTNVMKKAGSTSGRASVAERVAFLCKEICAMCEIAVDYDELLHCVKSANDLFGALWDFSFSLVQSNSCSVRCRILHSMLLGPGHYEGRILHAAATSPEWHSAREHVARVGHVVGYASTEHGEEELHQYRLHLRNQEPSAYVLFDSEESGRLHDIHKYGIDPEVISRSWQCYYHDIVNMEGATAELNPLGDSFPSPCVVWDFTELLVPLPESELFMPDSKVRVSYREVANADNIDLPNPNTTNYSDRDIHTFYAALFALLGRWRTKTHDPKNIEKMKVTDVLDTAAAAVAGLPLGGTPNALMQLQARRETDKQIGQIEMSIEEVRRLLDEQGAQLHQRALVSQHLLEKTVHALESKQTREAAAAQVAAEITEEHAKQGLTVSSWPFPLCPKRMLQDEFAYFMGSPDSGPRWNLLREKCGKAAEHLELFKDADVAANRRIFLESIIPALGNDSGREAFSHLAEQFPRSEIFSYCCDCFSARTT
jgi:hypothetical protein